MSESNKSQIDRIVLAATLYYKEKLSQQEIAKRLGVSRPWVSKLLTRAEELGIVRIEIQSPISGNTLYQEKLREKFPNTDIRVIDMSEDGEDYLAIAAVNYFISRIQPDDLVGVGWGNGVTRFLDHMIPLNFSNTSTVSLAGSFGTTFEVLPSYNSIKLAEKLGGKANVLHIPAFCASEEEYNTLIHNEETRKILELGEAADILIVGIGSFSSSFLTQHSIFSVEEQEDLKKSGAAGDMILQFMDEEGEAIRTPLTNRLIHADVYNIRKNAGHVIAIAQGEEKASIIRGVLKRQLVDTLFIDSQTAKALIDKENVL